MFIDCNKIWRWSMMFNFFVKFRIVLSHFFLTNATFRVVFQSQIIESYSVNPNYKWELSNSACFLLRQNSNNIRFNDSQNSIFVQLRLQFGPLCYKR